MADNKIYKDNNQILTIQAETKSILNTKVEFFSFDSETARFIFKLQKDRQPLPISNAAKIFVVLKFTLNGVEKKRILDSTVDEELTVQDSTEGTISLVIPSEYRGYVGMVTGGVYVQFDNGQSLDCGYFRFTMKKSMIDETLEDMSDFYVSTFESLHEQILTQSTETQELLDTITTEVAALEENYAPQLNTLTAQLAETDTEVKGTAVYAPSPSAFWVAPPQPPARIDKPGYFTNGFAGTADEYINTLFEPLRAKNSEYITRQNLGKDQSGLYDVWRYDFTPPNYEKTIIITGTIHGGENQSTLAFYLFMKQVCESWKDYPQLAYLRHKVRIISIPIANPWGLSQAPRVRANVNGVNLNRNFDYKWQPYITYSPGHADYKGNAVWSEKETQYIRDLVSQYSDSIAYLDLHALGAGSGKKAYLYSPRSYNVGDESTWREFFEWFTKGQPYRWMMVENPMSCNWASKEFGMYASTPEWVTGEWGAQTFDAVEMTKSTEFFGNIILMFAQKYKTPKVTKTTEPVLHRANYIGSNPSPLQITGNSYVAVPELSMEFEVPTSGILMINGEISVKSDTATSISYIMPTVGQPGGLIEPGQLLEAYYGIYYEGDKRTTNPISAAFPVKPDNGDGTNKVKIQLWARTNLGILSIYRYRLNVLFIPSERTDSVKMYSSTGKEGSGEGAMTIIQNGFS